MNKQLECFKNAIKLKPNFSIAFCNLGIAYNKNGNFKLSEENYNESILYDKKNIIAHYNLGNLYKDKNDLLKCRKIL